MPEDGLTNGSRAIAVVAEEPKTGLVYGGGA